MDNALSRSFNKIQLFTNKLVNGRPRYCMFYKFEKSIYLRRHPQSQGSVERRNKDVEDILHRWMLDNNSSKWALGIHFVQHEKNIRHHTGIKAVPYELLYGQRIRVGLSECHISKELMENLCDEEDLLLHFPNLSENLEEQMISEEIPVVPSATTPISVQNTIPSLDPIVECVDEHVEGVAVTTETLQGENTVIFLDSNVESALELMISGPNNILDDDITPPQSPIQLSGTGLHSPVTLEFDTPNRGVKRAQAAESMIKQASKMRKYAGGREEVKKFLAVGDVVLLKAQKTDRGRCDPTQFPGVVVAVTVNNSYRIGCVGGVLQSTYQRMDLLHKNLQCPELYNLQEILDSWQTAPVISEREAIAKISPVGGQGVKRCSCTTGCTSNRCACKKAGVLCNSKSLRSKKDVI